MKGTVSVTLHRASLRPSSRKLDLCQLALANRTSSFLRIARNGLGLVSGAGAKPKKRHAFAAISHAFCCGPPRHPKTRRVPRKFVWPGNALISQGRSLRCRNRVPAPTAEAPLSRHHSPATPQFWSGMVPFAVRSGLVTATRRPDGCEGQELREQVAPGICHLCRHLLKGGWEREI
jgi:hypothetical protein